MKPDAWWNFKAKWGLQWETNPASSAKTDSKLFLILKYKQHYFIQRWFSKESRRMLLKIIENLISRSTQGQGEEWCGRWQRAREESWLKKQLDFLLLTREMRVEATLTSNVLNLIFIVYICFCHPWIFRTLYIRNFLYYSAQIKM